MIAFGVERKQQGNSMISRIALMVPFFAVAACATTPVPVERAQAVPADRLLAFQADNTKSGGSGGGVDVGNITVTRDKGMTASGCTYELSINSTKAAVYRPGETATFSVPAGDVLLGVGPTPGVCGSSAVNVETTLKAEEKKRFNISVDQTMALRLQRSE
ncbi:hypothetical protein [Hydrocarboniphaga effusa]|uniref:hypothetical protein n=1 Tax=Hydrocarboniphaga effusa TaxID=243629 RepID=UPI003BAB605D